MHERPVKLSCKGVWKFFGGSADLIRSAVTGTPDIQALQDAGLVAAVQDASFDIHEGEIFIIMGLSGSGKSTLVRCLTKLVEPTAGSVVFNGDNLLSMPEKELIDVRRHKMGMVFQHFALLPHLNVLDNVAFPLSIRGVNRRDREKRAYDMIELVGLKGRESYYPRELSGGQQQRVGIARSLAVEPEVWFLDEPFSALDPLIRREMQNEFMRLQSVLRKTIVFITHDFDEAIRLADRIAIMQDGKIVQIGSPEELVLNPATGYVADFTREIPRVKVLKARSIMSRDFEAKSYAQTVDAAARVEDFAADVIHTDGEVGVIDANGALVGTLTSRDVMNVLVGNHSRQ
ncbi:MAG: betaine/proline/choline family ABC transporter ATP-binding protein [Gammaproteobacteria bacterium]|nr:betaine/proline/choline family ABC transporter ATP-binding protein [Gammaproteobacteria bacterium]